MNESAPGAMQHLPLRALLDLAPVPLVLQDSALHIVMVNAAFELATGFVLAQCEGRDLAQLDPAQDPRAQVLRRQEDAELSGSFQRQGLREGEFGERRVRRANGSVYTFRQQYRDLRGPGGAVLRFSILLDAEAAAAGRALIDFHGDRMAAAFGQVGIATLGRDAGLRIIDFDHGLLALTGFRAEDLLGRIRVLDDERDAESPQSLQARLEAMVVRRLGVDDAIVSIRTADGGHRRLRHRCAPVLRGRHLQGLVCVLSEIDAEAQRSASPDAEGLSVASESSRQALDEGWRIGRFRDSRAPRLAWGLAPDLVLLLDPADAPAVRAGAFPIRAILDCNGRCVEILGLYPEALLADAALLVRGFEPASREQFLTFWRRAREAGEGVHEVEVGLAEEGGGSRRLRLRLSAAPADRPWLLVIEDVTRQRALERQREQTAGQQRDVLVREVHHRIKNNLQGVAGLIQQIADHRPELAGALDQIVAQVQAIAQVHGMQVVNGANLGPIAMVDAICRHLARNFGVPIGIDGGETEDDPAVGLPESEAVPLALIISELGTNAIKHRVPGGRVAVRWQAHDEGVRIEFVNDGTLPADFERLSRMPTAGHHGLVLIRSMMPRRGASLRFSQEAGQVIASLTLNAPVLVRPPQSDHA